MRRVGLVVLGSIFTLAAVSNCGSVGGLLDAGLGDGGTGLFDVGAADAQGTPPTSFTCGITYTETYTYPALTQVLTYWYAEIDADIAADSKVTATLCGHQCFGQGCGGCPTGAVCTGARPAATDCVSSGVSFENGRAVVSCGFRQQSNYTDPGTPDYDSGTRWTNGRLFVE